MHCQSVVKQEYLNPAYNSFKDYTSVNILARNQWGGVDNHPRLYGANFYMPIHLSRLGVGLTLLKEEIGLRNICSLSASLAHNLRISMQSYLSFGYGIGAELTSYDRDRIVAMNDNYLNYDIDWTTFGPSFKLGVFYADPHIFAGLSSNTVTGRSNDKNWYLPGLDFVCGAMYRLSRSVFFRPDLIIKYYRNEKVVVTESVPADSYVPPVFDLSVSFLLDERVWLSTSHRFNLAHTFSVDFLIASDFQLGYSFELGIGEGLNQFNSHAISLSYKINSGKALGGFQKRGRYIHGDKFKYLYR
jgi:type IX secretion system PorP/SprF family membrane protein